MRLISEPESEPVYRIRRPDDLYEQTLRESLLKLQSKTGTNSLKASRPCQHVDVHGEAPAVGEAMTCGS